MQTNVEPTGAAKRRGTVIIDKEKCLKCAVLAPDIATKAYDCTFDNGNKNCPAHDLIVVVGVDAERAGNSIAKAFKNGDFDRVAALFGRLNDYHPTVRADVARVFTEAVIHSELRAAIQAQQEQVEPEPEEAPAQQADAQGTDDTGGAEAAPEATTPKADAATQSAADKADWDD